MLPELFRDLGLHVPSRLQSRWTLVDGLKLHSRSSAPIAGRERCPFLLIHGLVISSLYMIPLAECIAVEHEVHALDLPGFGRSEAPDQVLAIRELADAVVAWMCAMQIDRCHLIGNSLGCEIAAYVAIDAPARVETVTMVGATMDPQAYAVVTQTLRLLRDALREPVALWMNWAFDFFRAGPRRAFGMTHEMFRDHIEHQLPRVTRPTLVIRGGTDPTVPQSAAEMLTALLPRGELLVIEDEPHCVHYTNPLRVWQAIHEHDWNRSTGTFVDVTKDAD